MATTASKEQMVNSKMAWAIFMRNVTSYKSSWKLSLLPNFFDPLFYLLGIGIGLGTFVGQQIQGMDYLSFIAPGLMAASAMNGASFESTYNMFVRMHFAKLYEAYISTPASVEDIAVGEMAWAVARSLIYGMAFFTILLLFTAFGYKTVTSWYAILVVPAIVVVGILFAAIGQLFTAYIKRIDLYSFYFTLFLTPMFLFSNIFFPIETIKYGPQIAWWTPLYHAVSLLRGLSHGHISWTLLVDTVWMISLAAIAWALAVRRLRKIIIA